MDGTERQELCVFQNKRLSNLNYFEVKSFEIYALSFSYLFLKLKLVWFLCRLIHIIRTSYIINYPTRQDLLFRSQISSNCSKSGVQITTPADQDNFVIFVFIFKFSMQNQTLLFQPLFDILVCYVEIKLNMLKAVVFIEVCLFKTKYEKLVFKSSIQLHVENLNMKRKSEANF